MAISWNLVRTTISRAIGIAALAVAGTPVGTLAATHGGAVALRGSGPDAALERLLREEALAGVVWSTVIDGRIATGGRGVADAARGTSLRADARVHVGSVAKTVLALGILRRVTEGRLDLDAPVAALLPDVPIANRWERTHPLRLRHLLDMTAGLDDVRLWHVFGTRATPDLPLVDVFRDDPDTLEPRTPPGTAFSYSNLGYTLAGLVLERSVGERYEDWVERELLHPIGMHESRMHYAETGEAGDTDPRLARGHAERRVPVRTPPVAVRPAAQFTTTAADMGRLAIFLMGDGTVDGRRLVAPELLRAMGRARTTEAARAGLATGYALGLAARDRHGAVGLCHGGSVAGFRALLCIYPRSRRAFFVAHNSDDEGARYERFDAVLVAHLGVAEAPVPSQTEDAGADRGRAGLYVPAPGRHSQFALADRLLGVRTLRFDDDGHARLRTGLGPERTLLRVGPGLYRGEDRVQAELVLLPDQGSGPRYATAGGSFRRVHVPAQALLVLLAAGGFASLAAWLVLPLARIRREPLRARAYPATVAVLALLAAAVLLALQPFQEFADPTPGSVVLAGATALLPFALLAQAWVAWRRRVAGSPWRIELALASAGLAAFGLLAGYGPWPIVTWRL